VFGYVEGSSYFMRQLALIEGARRLSLPEKVVLGEVQYDLSGKREVKERPYYLRLEYGVPFTFASIAKAAKVKVNISYSGKGWNDFRKSIDIRNNLMHPKNRKDIEVSEAEVATVWSGSVWFVLGYLLTFQAMMERSKAIAAKTKAKMDLLGKAIEEYKAKKKLD
jgi:hypothetical protein